MNFSFKISRVKEFFKYFLFLFLLSFLIFNWSKISWVFNPKALFRYLASEIEKEIGQKPSQPKEEKDFVEIEKENSIEILKIETSAPLVFVEEENEVLEALDRGVVLFPNSAPPGQAGQTIILGHSAPPGWPKIKYDWVFSQLGELENGDEIFVYFENKKFRYSVVEKIFLEKGQEIPKDINGSKNTLILISCWPPGKDLKRIAIIANLNPFNNP